MAFCYFSTNLFSLRSVCRISRSRFKRVSRCSCTMETSRDMNGGGSQSYKPLYDGHIPTSFLQKSLLSLGSAAMAISNPSRDDMVAVLGETTGYSALRKMRDGMLNHPEGLDILRERPRINSVTLNYDYLRSLPENSLAGVYLKFLDDNKVSPDTRRLVHFVDDEELAYVIQRYREVHDLVHAVLGMPTNMLGEVAVKWIEAIQTGLPMCVMAALFGPVRLSKKQRQLYVTSYLPWAIKCGYHSEPLINVYFERHWDEPVDQLKRRLNISELNK